MENLKLFIHPFEKLIHAIHSAGGQFIFVGGFVRDILLGHTPKDFDAEIYNLSLEKLISIIKDFDEYSEVGKSFGVLKLKNYSLDICLPRQEEKIAIGHKGFKIALNHQLTYKEGARRRDLTVNSMGYDPMLDKILDPYHGQQDLANGILRATDQLTFPEDPLRGLRVAQFIARFGMKADSQLMNLCQQLDLSELPTSRILEELKKLFIKGIYPSLGLNFLKECGLLNQILPEFQNLSLNKWDHLLSVLDQGAHSKIDFMESRGEEDEDKRKFIFMMTLFLGKSLEADASKVVCERLAIPHKNKDIILCLINEINILKNLGDPLPQKSFLFWMGKRLLDHGLSWHDLLCILKTYSEHASSIVHLSEILLKTGALNKQNLRPVVQGKDLIEYGLVPNKNFKDILDQCLVVQYEKGLTTVPEILSWVI